MPVSPQSLCIDNFLSYIIYRDTAVGSFGRDRRAFRIPEAYGIFFIYERAIMREGNYTTRSDLIFSVHLFYD